jgi:hypothetical protein
VRGNKVPTYLPTYLLLSKEYLLRERRFCHTMESTLDQEF